MNMNQILIPDFSTTSEPSLTSARKKNEDGKYLLNGQTAKSGLNKSWNDAAFGQFFSVLEYIAAKAPGVDDSG